MTDRDRPQLAAAFTWKPDGGPSHGAEEKECEEMCSTHGNAELQPTRKSPSSRPAGVGVVMPTLRRQAAEDDGLMRSLKPFLCPPPPRPAASDPALLLELKTRRPPSLLELAGCETWSVDFSPDGAWFAWSMGHGIIWVVAWPLDSQCVRVMPSGVARTFELFSKIFLSKRLNNGKTTMIDCL